MHPRFRAAADALRAAPRTSTSICEPLQTAFGVDDAGIATYANPFDVRVVCAAGRFALPFGELQLDLGEGPGWDAVRSREPVLDADVRVGDRWPALADRMPAMRVQSVYAFPLSTGTLEVGALCLSSESPRRLDEDDVAAAAELAPLAARAVLARIMRDSADPDEGTSSLREVHQATGMVAAQLRLGTDDALLALRAHAFSEGRPVIDVARDIVSRRLDLSRD